MFKNVSLPCFQALFPSDIPFVEPTTSPSNLQDTVEPKTEPPTEPPVLLQTVNPNFVPMEDSPRHDSHRKEALVVYYLFIHFAVDVFLIGPRFFSIPFQEQDLLFVLFFFWFLVCIFSLLFY